MGVGANSDGNKSLNDRAERAAGRQKDRGPAQEAIGDAQGKPVKGKTGGAFGKGGRTPAGGGSGGLEGGGGGGASPNSSIVDVGAAKRKAH